MAYYPPELAMLAPALMVDEEDEVCQVQLSPEGESEINLYSRFSSDLSSGLSKSGHSPNHHHHHHQGGQRRDYNDYNSKGEDSTFEKYMSRQTRPIPMPMPGLNDPPQSEPDYLDTPYQLKTLGPSLSSYTEYEDEPCCSSSGEPTANLLHNHQNQNQHQHPPYHHHHHHNIYSGSILSSSNANGNGPTGMTANTNVNTNTNSNANSSTVGATSMSCNNNIDTTMGGISPPSTSTSDLLAGTDVEVKQSDSSESQAYYGTENVVRELRMEYVRWFYKAETDKLWIPFTGYDSMRIEARYRELVLREEEDLLAAMAQQEQENYCRTGGLDLDSTFDSPERRLNSRGYSYQSTAPAPSNTSDIMSQQQTSSNVDKTVNCTSSQNPSQPSTPKNMTTNTSSVLSSVSTTMTTSNTSTNTNNSNNNNNSSSSSSSRTNRVYRSFTRKWLEWSGPNPGMLNLTPKNEGGGIGNNISNGGSNSSGANSGQSGSNNNNTSTNVNNITSASSQQQQQQFQQQSASTCSRLQWPPVPPPNNPDNIIIVRGGLYEVDLEHNICYATYWPDMCQITRGTWFYDGSWQPIDSQHADKLEIEHLEKFGGASLVTPHVETLPDSPTKKNKQVAHRISFTDFHVDWTSATEIHLYSKAVSHKLMRSVSMRLGFQTGGHRICRGYFKQCMLSDRPAEINHIVFVVHGIGQKMDTGRIVRNCAAFRECVSTLKKQLYPQSEICRQKAEFFPVEWRSAAKLDGDIVDAITPHKLLGLRQMLNATAMDIMYYTSPLYRTEIQNALRSELNRIYSNFVKRNPNFEARGGKVSVLAHSLGVVITYDIMTGYISPLRSDCPELRSIELNGVDTNEEINHEGILVIDDVTSEKIPEQPRLLFKLEHFFCLGSPLAVFLALRWKEPHNPDLRSYILPPNLCKRIYNVFHPSDPVAYRLEPLLNKYYIKIAPLLIHSSGSSSKTKYDEMEKELINRDLPSNMTKLETNNAPPPPNPTGTSTPTPPQQEYATNSSSSSQFSTHHQQAHSSFRSSTSLNTTPQKCSPAPLSSSFTSSSNPSGGMGNPTLAGFSVFNSNNNSSNNCPKSPPTPSKDSNWSWFNLMKYWKSENAADFSDAAGMESSEYGGNSEQQSQPGGGLSSPEAINYLNSPPCRESDGGDAFITNIPNDLEYRMDYVLRESNLSSSYLAALTSHTSYWTTLDVAYFVLMHLYNGVLESQPE